MTTPPRSRTAACLGLALLAAAAALVLAAPSGATTISLPLYGKFLNIANFRGPGCPSATGVCSSFTAVGVITGTGVVSVDTQPDPANFGFSKAHTVIHTFLGDLTCHEAALFDLVGADHAFVDLCLIDGGTGRYAGASGYIQEVGTFDFAANRGQLDYYGKLVYTV